MMLLAMKESVFVSSGIREMNANCFTTEIMKANTSEATEMEVGQKWFNSL